MTENQRLFIAIAPPSAVKTRLHTLAHAAKKQVGGRDIAIDNLHLTLVFLGNTPVEQISCIIALLNSMSAIDCTLTLDILDHFPRGGILWAGCQNAPEALIRHVAEIRAALIACSVPFDDKPFRTHVTLLRKATPLTQAIAIEPPLDWILGRAQLFTSQCSLRGPVYQVVSCTAIQT